MAKTTPQNWGLTKPKPSRDRKKAKAKTTSTAKVHDAKAKKSTTVKGGTGRVHKGKSKY